MLEVRVGDQILDTKAQPKLVMTVVGVDVLYQTDDHGNEAPFGRSVKVEFEIDGQLGASAIAEPTIEPSNDRAFHIGTPGDTSRRYWLHRRN